MSKIAKSEAIKLYYHIIPGSDIVYSIIDIHYFSILFLEAIKYHTFMFDISRLWWKPQCLIHEVGGSHTTGTNKTIS